MNTNSFKIKSQAWLCLIFFIGMIGLLNAQTTLEYEHSINDSLKGQVIAESKDNENDSIFDGKFQFYTTFGDKDLQQRLASLSYKGQYAENLKNDDWLFSFKTFKAHESFYEKDYHLNYKTSGDEFLIKANFLNAKAEGKWTITKQNFQNSEPRDFVFKIDAEFEKSKLVNAIKAEFPSVKLNGQFDDKGFIDGEWIFLHDINGVEIHDILSFKNGVLDRRQIKIEGKTFDINLLGLNKKREHKFETTTYNTNVRDFFNLVEFEMSTEDNEFLSENIQKINEDSIEILDQILQSFSEYKSIEIWQHFRGSEKLTAGLFKIKTHPLSKSERNRIDKMTVKFFETSEQIQQVFEHPNFDVGKLNYKALNRYEAVLKAYQKRLKGVKPTVEILNLKAVKYINREEILPLLLQQNQYPEQIVFQFKNEEFTEDYDFQDFAEADQFELEQLSKLIDVVSNDVAKIDKEATEMFEKLTKKAALSDREKELVDLKKQVVALFDNAKTKSNYNAYHKELSGSYISAINKFFNEYTNLSVDEKKENIDWYIGCFENFILAYEEIADFPKKLNWLDELYSKTSFNPFLMEEMTERLKERIYKAFEDYLFPEVLDELKQTDNCDDILKTLNNFTAVYERMLVLIDEDTSDIEKELKREKDPETILNILEVSNNE